MTQDYVGPINQVLSMDFPTFRTVFGDRWQTSISACRTFYYPLTAVHAELTVLRYLLLAIQTFHILSFDLVFINDSLPDAKALDF